MAPKERKEKIFDFLKETKSATVGELAERFQVTRPTIRSDLEELERRGLIIRTHGGAHLAEEFPILRIVSDTLQEARKEKEIIASLAVSLLHPRMTVIIDGGSTTAYLSRRIKLTKIEELTVITNSLLVMQDLAMEDGIELFVPAGAVRKPSLSIISSSGRSFYDQINADILFLGAAGFTLEQGANCSNIIEAETKQQMIRRAARVCLLADSSKLGKMHMAHICDWGEIDMLITNSLPPESRSVLEKKGIEVITGDARGGN